MNANLLKLNQEKTELMVFTPKNRLADIEGLSLSFGNNTIHNTPFVRNLGTYFDTSLTMEKHCNELSKSCYFHLRNIGRIRNNITEEACKTLVNALVTSRLDYGNALLVWTNKQLTNKLQRVHNTAARLIILSNSKIAASVTVKVGSVSSSSILISTLVSAAVALFTSEIIRETLSTA